MMPTNICWKCSNNPRKIVESMEMTTVELEDFAGDACDLCRLIQAFHVGLMTVLSQEPASSEAKPEDAEGRVLRELLAVQSRC